MASKTVTQLRKDYRKSFTGESGERVLRNLMINCGLTTSGYRPGMTPMELAFNEGQRSVVLAILAELQERVDPKKFLDDMYNSDIDLQRMTAEI